LDPPPAAGTEAASTPVAEYQHPAVKQAPPSAPEVALNKEEEPDDLPF
jgi:hypothetical protein